MARTQIIDIREHSDYGIQDTVKDDVRSVQKSPIGHSSATYDNGGDGLPTFDFGTSYMVGAPMPGYGKK